MKIDKLPIKRQIKNVKFANINKNNHLGEYYYQVFGKQDYFESDVIYDEIIQLNDYEWSDFIYSLLEDKEYLKGKGGTTKINGEIKTIGILIRNTETFEKIIVDPEGFSYARYVGLIL